MNIIHFFHFNIILKNVNLRQFKYFNHEKFISHLYTLAYSKLKIYKPRIDIRIGHLALVDAFG